MKCYLCNDYSNYQVNYITEHKSYIKMDSVSDIRINLKHIYVCVYILMFITNKIILSSLADYKTIYYLEGHVAVHVYHMPARP